MASIIPTVACSSTSNVTAFPAKPLLFKQPKRCKSFKPVHCSSTEGEGRGPPVSDAVKLAFAKAQAYRKAKKDKEANPGSSSNTSTSTQKPENKTGREEMSAANIKDGLAMGKVNKKADSTISSIDFLGFDFSDKKRYRGYPPSFSPIMEPLLEGEIPEVEYIVGDASKFEVTPPPNISSDEDIDNVGIYKPTVSTWGVFPRPSNISKTFGGGRVIRPGEVLETVEDKAAKEKRSREMIAAYRKKMGMTIDPKTRLECEKALEEGDSLMDRGELRGALPYYEKVMKAVVFESELHGLAALQWSICQDSLCRANEARVMYEKLQSHPTVRVSKKARHFVFSFQAMEMLKVGTSSFSGKTGYENYFEAFVENKANYTPMEEEQSEGGLRQALPYILFLVSPIFVVVLFAVRKSF